MIDLRNLIINADNVLNAVILSDKHIQAKVGIFVDAGEKFQVWNCASVTVNFLEPVTNRHNRQQYGIKFCVAMNVSDLPPRRIEYRNIDVNKSQEVSDKN